MCSMLCKIVVLCFLTIAANARSDYGSDREEFEDAEVAPNKVPKLSIKLDLQNGENAFVLDNVISNEQRLKYMYYARSQSGTVFTLANYSWTQNTNSNIGLTPFVTETPLEDIKSSAAWKQIKTLLNKEFNGKKIVLEYGQYEILHSLDARPPVQAPHCAENRYVATIFLCKYWKNNNYGQVSFYNEMKINKNITMKPRFEIVETVHPRGGRVVVYPSCQINVYHPPTPSYFQHLSIINFWFTVDKGSEIEPLKSFVTEVASNREPNKFNEFKFSSSREKTNFKENLKRVFYDSTGKKGIFVLDDLFTQKELREWRSHLLRYENPGLNEFDSAALEDNDNVAYLAQFSISSFMQTEMWERVLQQISFVSNESDWYPYDVALNHIFNSDHTRIHPDSESHQYEYTYLLYLTEGVSTKHMGETIWVEHQPNSDGITFFTGEGGEECEPHAAVKPKFGRVAIFRNNVEHSARPFNTEYHGARYSFAVKVGKSKRNALVKLCYEAMEALDLNPQYQKLNAQLQMGMHDEGTNSNLSVEKLEKIYEKVKKLRQTTKTEEIESIKKIL